MKVNFVFDEGSSKEDTYLIGENIFGVFDGANSTNRFFDKDGRSGGLIAASIARDEFVKNDSSLKNILISANDKIRERMISENIDMSNKLNLWCSQAAVVRTTDRSFEWIQVGDSLILVIYKNGQHKLLVENYDHDREELILWRKYADAKKIDIIKLIRKELDERRKLSNIDFGHLNGEIEMKKFIKHGEEDLGEIKHIILFTDGLFIPKENPEENDDFDTFVKLFLEGGLKKIKDYIRDLQKGDPNCWKYPRFKQYDDITAISISFD